MYVSIAVYTFSCVCTHTKTLLHGVVVEDIFWSLEEEEEEEEEEEDEEKDKEEEEEKIQQFKGQFR